MAKLTSKTGTNEIAFFASSSDGEAVHAVSNSLKTAAVAAFQTNTTLDADPEKTATGAGVYSECHGGGAAIYGRSFGTWAAIMGENLVETTPGPGGVPPGGRGGPGSFFKSEQKEAVIARTNSPKSPAIAAFQDNPSSDPALGPAIHAESAAPNGTAALFKGNVIVTGDVQLPGADFAEDFTIEDKASAEPGTVMALNNSGELVPCYEPYNRRVVGVVAGGGSYRPAIIMDKQTKATVRRQPIALVGKVFCKVDASYEAIDVGDLLTSSATHGCAMKAADPTRAFGSVIGKALAPFGEGLGLIPVLISLQ
jgi:hypothetical protein